MMKLQNFKIVFLSAIVVSFLAFIPLDESFASEITYEVDPGLIIVPFRDISAPLPPDSDGDGIPDFYELCDDDPETVNGFEDFDGCPDVVPPDPEPDEDGDSIPDEFDLCPDDPETFNLFQDEDGCPETRACFLDKVQYNKGETVILTIEDYNANLQATIVDFTPEVVVQPSSTTTVIAEETGVTTAIFDGDFEATDNLEVGAPDGDVLFACQGDSEESARAKIALPLSAGGNVTINDEGFTENELANIGIKPVIGAINVELTDGATFSSVPTVLLSYANANFPAGSDKHDIQMWYKAPGQLWELITPSNKQLFFSNFFLDQTAMTVRSNPAGDGFNGDVDGQGAYVLALNVGQGGGGGGGLVRPSLVVNVLAGIGGGSFGGGAGGLPPLVEISELVKYSLFGIPLEIEEMVLNHDSAVPISPMDIGLFENFDYPITINDKGFVLSGFTSTITPQTIKTDSPTVIKFIVYDNTKIQHFSFYTNLRDANSQIHQSDTQILYNDGQPLKVIDPNGFFSDVTVTINEINEIKREVVFEITFAKPMDTSDIIIRIWDPYLNSRDAFILDAFEVVSEIDEEPPTPTFEEPVIEESQSQSIPKWIKNNAAWWSEQQISDSDFVSGIEYLIKNGIINVPGVDVGTGSASTEIPEWIKNTAGWWADSLITDGDFTEAMQWLVANGVIQI